MNAQRSGTGGIVATYCLWDWLRLQGGANHLGVPADFERAARVAEKVGDEQAARELGVLAEAMRERWSVPDLMRALNAKEVAT